MKGRSLLRGVTHYGLFFLIVAFLVTCCTLLFVDTMARSLNLTLTAEGIGLAAKLTFGNVLLLSLLFTLVDFLRRKWMVDRPVKRILRAAERMTAGDFSVRIPPIPSFAADESFNQIIACFNQMAEDLSGVETLRTDFIANVSHEMKTPLAIIQNYGTLLRQLGLTEEQRMEYAAAISDASRRLSDMMSNILKLNRMENQSIYPQVTEYDLGEQLCECLLQFETQWERTGIEVETELADGIRIRADGELLSLVWNNLFSNAFKFTPAGGTVSVTLTATQQHAIVRVADTGCGMTPEVGAHIFEKFYQGDPSHATQGNGLGLALVKRVMDLTQGEITVESTPGLGSTFTVKLRRV